MAWRVLNYGDTQWNVTVAAERAAQSTSWRLVLAFRAAGLQRRALWTPYPLVSTSKASLFAQADRLTDEKLTAVLADHLD